MTREEMKKQTMERVQAERSEKVVAIAFFVFVAGAVTTGTLTYFLIF